MCLPEGCLKKTLGFFAFGIILLGILIITIASIALSQDSSNPIFDNYDDNWASTMAEIMLGFGIATFFIGVMGVYGGCKKQRCFICIYNISIFPLTLFFLALAIGALVLAQFFLGNMQTQTDYNIKTQCNDFKVPNSCQCGEGSDFLTWLGDINTYTIQAANILGKKDTCIANLGSKKDLYENYLAHNQIFSLNPAYISDTVGFTSVTQCLNQTEYQAINNEFNNYFMSYLEEKFDCSGLCSPVPYYLFSNIQNTPIPPKGITRNVIPKSACYRSVYNYLDSYGTAIYGTCFGIFGFFFIQMILSICLCCKKKKQSGNFYQKMDYLD